MSDLPPDARGVRQGEVVGRAVGVWIGDEAEGHLLEGERMRGRGDEVSELIETLQGIVAPQRTFGELSPAQMNWRESSRRWSIGQCLEHLIITNRLYFTPIRAVVEGRHRNNVFSRIPLTADLVAALLKNSLKPEQKRRMKTFRIFEPRAGELSSGVLDDFVENQREFIGLLEACRDHDLHGIKIPEPLSPALNLRLGDAFAILVMHEKRHLLQAERLLGSKGFPR